MGIPVTAVGTQIVSSRTKPLEVATLRQALDIAKHCSECIWVSLRPAADYVLGLPFISGIRGRSTVFKVSPAGHVEEYKA